MKSPTLASVASGITAIPSQGPTVAPKASPAQAAHAQGDRVRSLVAGHGPRPVERVLRRPGGAETAVERAEDPDRQSDAAALERVHVLAQLAADDRELGERRVDQPVLEAGIPLQHEAEDGHEQEQQREQRQEPVVGDQRRQVGALVVAELVDHREGEAQPAVTALVGVYRVDNRARHRPRRRLPATVSDPRNTPTRAGRDYDSRRRWSSGSPLPRR